MDTLPLSALGPMLTAASRRHALVAVGGLEIGDWREMRPCVVDCDPESDTYEQAIWIGSKYIVLDALRKGLLRPAGKKGALALYTVTREGLALRRDIDETVDYWRRAAKEAQDDLADLRDALHMKGPLQDAESIAGCILDCLQNANGAHVPVGTLHAYVATTLGKPIGPKDLKEALRRLRRQGCEIIFKRDMGYLLTTLPQTAENF
jgi:hypothetical protein